MTTEPAKTTRIGCLAQGLTWEEMNVGACYGTAARTVTETDLINFVSLCGFTDALFLNANHPRKCGYTGRLIPGALTYSLAEGLILQSNLLQGTGLAFLGMELSVLEPVYVGDTISVMATVLEARPSRQADRGVVTSENIVANQNGHTVLRYRAVRLIRSGTSR